MIQSAAYRLLGCFVESNERNFADLCAAAGYPTDLGGYYLRQLVRLGYLERQDRGVYALTVKGRTQITVAQDKHTFVVRPRLVVLIVAKCANEYVAQRRNCQPFIGTAEWPAGAVNLGETLPDAVRRVTKVRLGANVTPALVGFFRRIDRYNNELFDDKIFAVHTVDLPSTDTGLYAFSNTIGQLELYDGDSISNVAKPARSLLDILDYVNQASASSVPYVEQVYDLMATDFEPNVAS